MTIVGLDPRYIKEYNQVVKAFNNRQCDMILFKNVGILTQQGNWCLGIEASSIISIVVDDFIWLQVDRSS